MGYDRNLQLMLDSNCFKELENFYINRSILDIVGVSRKEQVHSNFLWWLLDINQSHQLGSIPLRNFLFACAGQKYRMLGNYELVDNEDYIFPKEWTDILLPFEERYEIQNFKIYREYPLKNVGRIDLLLECKLIVNDDYKNKIQDKANNCLDLLFVIENKIDSCENNKQTIKYYNYFENEDKKFKNKKKIYIYLVPDTQLNKPLCDNFLPFQYSDLITTTIKKCFEKPMLPATMEILNNYLRCLSFSSDADNSIVAITDNEINLVAELWCKYSNSLQYLLTHSDLETSLIYVKHKEVFDNIYYISVKFKECFENINKEYLERMKKRISTKGSTTYEYKGEVYKRNGGKYSLSRLALKIIKDYIDKYSPNLEDLLKELENICPTYQNIPLIIEEKDAKNPEYLEDEETGRSMYFNNADDVLEISNSNKKYVLYSFWSNSELKKLIQFTNANVKENDLV